MKYTVAHENDVAGRGYGHRPHGGGAARKRHRPPGSLVFEEVALVPARAEITERAVKRPAHPYKSTTQTRFTAGNAKGT